MTEKEFHIIEEIYLKGVALKQANTDESKKDFKRIDVFDTLFGVHNPNFMAEKHIQKIDNIKTLIFEESNKQIVMTNSLIQKIIEESLK